MGLDAYVDVAKHAGLSDGAGVLDALARLDGDADEIADTLRRHHLLRFVRELVPVEALRARVRPDVVAAIERRRPVGRVAVRTLLDAFDEVRRTLAAAGVPVLVLKGFAFAERLYGGLDRRPQHDVDLLVPPGRWRRARRALAAAGFVRRKRDLHSVAVERGPVQLDLHRHLRWAPAFRLDEDALWERAVELRIDGVAVPAPSDEHALLLLVLSAFEDLGQGLEKLKHLLDLHLLTRAVDATMDWDGFFARRDRENVLGVTTSVLAIVTALFEAGHATPRLAQALAARPAPGAIASRTDLLALVFAPAKDPRSLAWFARVYPGSVLHYLAWFWWGGLPGNLGRLGPRWLASQVRVLYGARGGRL